MPLGCCPLVEMGIASSVTMTLGGWITEGKAKQTENRSSAFINLPFQVAEVADRVIGNATAETMNAPAVTTITTWQLR